ncbi:MAG: alanine--glyoxylate aminotransferase family protein, partial [bacterium]|nr:alanine--glyoxylate aminotransferase family protein [Candidatus Kapabacteria bacterium]
DGGKFGERWGAIASAYGITAHALKVTWGQAPTIDDALAMLEKHPAAKAFCFTHSETSTGSYTDVRAMAAALRKRFDGLIIVDGITAVGAHEMRFDDWDIDIVVTGSQKGLMIPPGLAFIALSDRAWKATETSTLPKFYYSMQKAKKNLVTWDTPWTPAVTLVIGLGDALEMIRKEGVENVWSRHDRLARALRAAMKGVGLRLFADPASNAVTSVYLPERGDEFYSSLKKKYGITAAAGQDDYKGKIFRVSHLGYYDEADMFSVIYAIESALADVNHKFLMGVGLVAALREINMAAREVEVTR